jgi:hypothetical protein
MGNAGGTASLDPSASCVQRDVPLYVVQFRVGKICAVHPGALSRSQFDLGFCAMTASA